MAACTTAEERKAERQRQTGQRLEEILATYFRLVDENSVKNEPVSVRVSFAREEIAAGRLSFVIDHETRKPLLEGVSYTVVDRSRSVVVVNSGVIDAYVRHPSAVYSMLTNAFTHAHSFHNSRDLFLAALEGNELEKYLFAKDAYFIEALFIKEYLAPRKLPLTEFEQFLLDSFTNNNLAEFSFFLLGYDMELTHTLYRMGSEEKMSPQETLARMFEVGGKITKDLADLNPADPAALFKKLVPAITYLVCIRHAKLEIPVTMKDGKPVPDKMAERLRKDIEEQAHTIHTRINPHLPVYVAVKRAFYEKITRID